MKSSKPASENKSINGKKQSIYDKLAFIPIIIILGVVPLVVRLKMQAATGQDMSYALGNKFDDLFSYWKASATFAIAILMVLMGFFFFRKKEVKISPAIKIGMFALVSFAVISLLSAIVSPHKNLVWWGQYELRGGFVTIVSYVIICGYSLYFYKGNRDAKYILIPLSIMIIVETIIILSQFIGYDMMLSEFVKSLIIPSEYKSIANFMISDMNGKSYGTVGNPNYIGSFVALLFPIFAVSAIKIKDFRQRGVYIIVAIALIFSLFASGSRAGIVGLCVGIVLGVMLLGQTLIKNPKVLVSGMVIIVLSVVGMNVVTGGMVIERVGSIAIDAMTIFKNGNSDILENSAIKDVYIKDDKLTIDFGGQQLNLVIESDDNVVLADGNGNNIAYTIENEKYIVPSVVLPTDVKFQVGKINYENGSEKLYGVEIDQMQWFLATVKDGQWISLDNYYNPITIEKAKFIGFSGKEHIGSNRGYIWSRTLSMMMDNLLLGVGPDAFVTEFPHGDIVVRNAVYGTPSIILDKPHNLYLQIGINQGIIALLAFLVLNITYVINSFKVYFKKSEYSFHDMFGIGIMLGIVGYLGAGMFNDSVVSVAPMYWCLLGIGYAVNFINEKESI